jgi:hypothetical protein
MVKQAVNERDLEDPYCSRFNVISNSLPRESVTLL